MRRHRHPSLTHELRAGQRRGRRDDRGCDDYVNRTPSPQTTTTDKGLKRFTERITRPRQSPLLELSGVETPLGGCAPPSLPKRSRQIAVYSIAHIPMAKRGEYLVLKHLLELSNRSRLRRRRPTWCMKIRRRSRSHVGVA